MQVYFDQIKDLQKHTVEEERELSLRIQAGDARALQALVQANLKFVVAVCKNYRNQGLTFGDLIGEGNLGLIRAAQRFDHNAGCRFISYAVWWIRQSILVALADQGRFLKVPAGLIGAMSHMGRANRKLEQILGRPASPEEVSEHLGLSGRAVTECAALNVRPLSFGRLDVAQGPGLEETLEDRNGDRTDRGSDAYLLRRRMAKALDALDDRKAEVLKMAFGIGSDTAYTLSEIAEKLDISRERVRQIKAKAIGQLQHPARRRLVDFREAG